MNDILLLHMTRAESQYDSTCRTLAENLLSARADLAKMKRAIRHAIEFLDDLELRENPCTEPESPEAVGFWSTLAELRACAEPEVRR